MDLQNIINETKIRLGDKLRALDNVSEQRDLIRENVREVALLGNKSMREVVDKIYAEMHGIGSLQALADMDGVTDILVNAANEIWIDRGFGLERIGNDILTTDESVRDLANKLITNVGLRLDDSMPIADATTHNGIRINAVLSPVAKEKCVLSFRIPRRKFLKFEELVTAGTIPENAIEFVRKLVTESKNILISGSTGAGKTTLLAALLSLVSSKERIICIEEVRELPTDIHPHIVSLAAKKQNVEGRGEVYLSELVKTSLRMRPDRIVLGEVRGQEIKELFMALNTGHSGSMCTIHANSVQKVPARLDTLAILANITPQSLAIQAAGALDYILQMKRIGEKRVLSEIGVPYTDDYGNFKVKLIAEYAVHDDGNGRMEFVK
ncbi:MAG: Flp pilus assembly complex ATPase component TadA [Bifidobacteriaceae bacterium]|jgi:pilus assembly protein CpaF|nr:Flp pilus assembly complex ATPase component TadA [Bifidobacteriaceae bacterium]